MVIWREWFLDNFHKWYSVNPRISQLEAYLFLKFLDKGEGGYSREAYTKGGSYEIIEDIKRTLLNDFVYSSKIPLLKLN